MGNGKKSLTLLLTLLIGFLFWLGPLWLAVYAVLLVVIFGLIKKISDRIATVALRKTVRGLALLFFVLLVSVSLRIFVMEVFRIPSNSMENALYPGDVIAVSKLEIGPALPRTPFKIPWLNIALYFNDEARARIKDNWWPYRRLPGTEKVMRGDVLVFTKVFGGKETHLVKRCVGLPGDEFQVKAGKLVVNGELYSPSEEVKNEYLLFSGDAEVLAKVNKQFPRLRMNRTKEKEQVFRAVMTNAAAGALKRKGLFDSLRIVSSQSHYVAPSGKLTPWSRNNYGKLRIPKKGLSVRLTPVSYVCYKDIIRQEEHAAIQEKDGKYWLDGKPVESYTFKQNYFFMMGDNRTSTIDSRCWGPVPESQLVGKVKAVLWSTCGGAFNWRRFLTGVR
ncbi:MAG: signal peptidase I [Cytophagales bacterium]|nr:signal peptidase I [Cytophagales bacterium]